jgi:hypothetical protein
MPPTKSRGSPRCSLVGLIRGWSSPDVWFNALAVAGPELEKRVPLFVQPTPMACETNSTALSA